MSHMRQLRKRRTIQSQLFSETLMQISSPHAPPLNGLNSHFLTFSMHMVKENGFFTCFQVKCALGPTGERGFSSSQGVETNMSPSHFSPLLFYVVKFTPSNQVLAATLEATQLVLLFLSQLIMGKKGVIITEIRESMPLIAFYLQIQLRFVCQEVGL